MDNTPANPAFDLGSFVPDERMEPLAASTVPRRLPDDKFQFDSTAKSIWEEFRDVLKDVPQAELDKLPIDGAERHDFYIYGDRKAES